VVLTAAIPFTLMALGDALGVALYGAEAAAQIDAFREGLFWRGMLAVCACSAVLGSRLLIRLEAVDNRHAEVQLPGWPRIRSPETSAAKAARVRPAHKHSLPLLVKKELRLHQLTFVIVGLYVGDEVTGLVLGRFIPRLFDFLPSSAPFLTSGLLSILIGALASAEERHLGTVEWHLLLPMSAWRQWTVKAGVVLVLTLLLGIGVPLVLGRLNPGGDEARFFARMWPESALGLVVLAFCSLYVPSVCTSGIHALVVTLPVLAGGVWFLQMMASAMWSALSYAWGGSSLPVLLRALRVSRVPSFRSGTLLTFTLAAAFIVMLFRFVDEPQVRGEKWQARQVACIAAFLKLSQLLLILSGR
jgi:hypothetical protein